MDYEKKYKDALEKAKEIVNDQNASSVWKGWLCNCFPELKESDDEKVRRVLREIVLQWKNGHQAWCSDDKEIDTILAWLEKQGDKKDICETCDHPMLNCQNFPCEEKRDEQKPTDKVEPKFHEGDMIIHKELGGDYIHNPHKIIQVDILDKKYRLEGGLVAHFGEQDDYEIFGLVKDFLDTLEVKEVDFDGERRKYLTEHFNVYEDGILQSKRSNLPLDTYDVIKIAKHFFELGMRSTITEEDCKLIWNIGDNLPYMPEEDFFKELLRRYKAQKGEKV